MSNSRHRRYGIDNDILVVVVVSGIVVAVVSPSSVAFDIYEESEEQFEFIERFRIDSKSKLCDFIPCFRHDSSPNLMLSLPLI